MRTNRSKNLLGVWIGANLFEENRAKLRFRGPIPYTVYIMI